MGQKGTFSREFKLEAVRLVRDRGVSVAQAARDLDIHASMLRNWMRQQTADPQSAFPGHGHLKPEQQEVDGRHARVLARCTRHARPGAWTLLHRPVATGARPVLSWRGAGSSSGRARRGTSL